MTDRTDGRAAWLESFKALSTFISSVIIAIAGIIVTSQYNSRQLELARNRAESELTLTRLREIAGLIPRLGSDQQQERRAGARGLGLYGAPALPALTALLADTAAAVPAAAVQSILIIGDTAVPLLTRIVRDSRATGWQRAWALHALGELQSDSAAPLAIKALHNRKEHFEVLRTAAGVLGLVQSKENVPALLSALHRYREKDWLIVQRSAWSLGELGDTAATELLGSLLDHQSGDVRIQAAWSLAQVNPQVAVIKLLTVAKNDSQDKVRTAATNAIEWARDTMQQ
jgi:HEAT repeat protein